MFTVAYIRESNHRAAFAYAWSEYDQVTSFGFEADALADKLIAEGTNPMTDPDYMNALDQYNMSMSTYIETMIEEMSEKLLLSTDSTDALVNLNELMAHHIETVPVDDDVTDTYDCCMPGVIEDPETLEDHLRAV